MQLLQNATELQCKLNPGSVAKLYLALEIKIILGFVWAFDLVYSIFSKLMLSR